MTSLGETSLGISKGYFVHKPVRKKNKKLKISSWITHENSQYESSWKNMEAKIQEIEKAAYKETFDNVMNFIERYSKISLNEVDEIPTCVLIMGVNMPDHIRIFQLLEQRLHVHDIFATVILQSKKCNTFSNMLQILVAEFVNKCQNKFGLEEHPIKRTDYCFSKLYFYYQSIHDKMESCQNTNHLISNSNLKPIVIMLQDVESFNADFLQQLIINCKLYMNKLPIVLIFGMSSALVTLHNILPQRSLCCLGIETFYSLTATEYLTKIIEEIIISPMHPFKLGPKVFRLVIDTVLYHDFSILNLTYILKFCMLEHFSKTISFLCCKQSCLKNNVDNLNGEVLQAFQKVPSLQIYLENNPDISGEKAKTVSLKALIYENLEKHYGYQKLLLILLRCLHCLVKDLPKYPLGKQFRELYSIALETEIVNHPGYKQAEKLWKIQSQSELLSKLNACLEVLNSSEMTSKHFLLIEIKATLKHYIEKISIMNDDDATNDVPNFLSASTEKIISRSQLQEQIRKSLMLKTSKFTGYKTELIEALNGIFRNIYPPSRIPLHEVFYFNNLASVKEHLMTSPRIISHHALSNPEHYLKCSCCKLSHLEEIPDSLPDICMLYKLHLESGRLINLYDWLESFKAAKHMDNKKTKGSNKKIEEKELEINTRFMQAVSELQLLGFIKSTKRKTDHVARLTFGSY